MFFISFFSFSFCLCFSVSTIRPRPLQPLIFEKKKMKNISRRCFSRAVNTKRITDLRSDTVTKPTVAMRKAMAEAVVGDDVYQEDSTVNALEERVAKMFGKENSLFVPTGTMSNLLAVLSWCQKRGSEVIMGNDCHIHVYEQGGISQFGGVSGHILPTNADGTLDLGNVESSVRSSNFHFPTTELVAIENTHNNCGGRVVPLEYVNQLGDLCRKYKLPLHVDGARIWNASQASGVPLQKMVSKVDSISACLSKGLGAPVGSLLIGSGSFIDKARRLRKGLGGGMRQSGVLAAAGMVALDDFENGMLAKDHQLTMELATGLSKIPGIIVDPKNIETNIIIFEVNREDDHQMNAKKFLTVLKKNGILALPKSEKMIRMVLHRDIFPEDIPRVLEVIRKI
jgi:threonine aldolase